MTRIGILGLGEAGSIVASDLARAGAQVVGFDLLSPGVPDGFTVALSPAQVAEDVEAVLAFTATTDAEGALHSVLAELTPGTLYADFSSSSPERKQRMAAAAAERDVAFADAVLLAPVLAARLATEVQASGTGAERLATLLGPLGMQITPIGARAGEAAARKLLRSIVMKGVTALLVESLRAADDEGVLDWFTDHVTETLTGITPEMLVRLLDGTLTHSERRVHEMEAAAEMVEASGRRAPMARATAHVLESASAGIPRGAALRSRRPA